MKTPVIGSTLKLTPKTRRGKNALQNKTNRWTVTQMADRLMCLDNQPGFFLREIRDDGREPDCRWIQLPTDHNFDWETVDN